MITANLHWISQRWADFEQTVVNKWRKRLWAFVKGKRPHFDTCYDL